LEPGERVVGHAALEGEVPVAFDGMLGFLSLFERLRAASRGSDIRDRGSDLMEAPDPDP
jgi:hypothetical protein